MELAAVEAELTREVPQLLETMYLGGLGVWISEWCTSCMYVRVLGVPRNRTSEEVNLFERKASEAQERPLGSAQKT